MDQVELFIAACAESATASAAGHHARQWLQDVTASPKPYPLCMSVIERVSNADDPMRSRVIFQCLSTIRHALEREWATLAADDVKWLQIQLSSLISACWVHGPVLNQATYTLAVILKRQWTVAEEQDLSHQVVSDIRRYLSDPKNQAAGLVLAQNIVSEFSSQHGSALNLTWESHITCHRSFERHALRPLCEVVLCFLVSQPISDLTGRTLNVIVTVLSWSFEESLSSDKLALRCMKPSSNDQSESLQTVLKPGPLWRDLLLEGQTSLVELISNVHYALLQTSVADRRSALRLARQALILLASLQGSIFPVNDGDRCLLRFVRSLCSNTLKLLVQVVGSSTIDEEAILDSCVLVQRLISCHGLKSIIQIGAGDVFLANLAHLTLELVPAGGSASTSLDTWANESFDILLDCWSACITGISQAEMNLQPYTDAIFQRYYRVRMETAHVSAIDEGDDQFYLDESRITFSDEQIVCIALLARVSSSSSLSILSETLQNLTSAQLTDERHESLCITLSLLTNVLADTFVLGEYNTIPNLILRTPPQFVLRAILSLMSLVRTTVHQIRSESTRAQLSPYAIQTLLSCLQSFCYSYLTFDSVSYEKLHIEVPQEIATFLEQSIPEALDLALQLIHAVLFIWDSEIEAGSLCGSLLQVLASNKKLRELIPLCSSWAMLISSFDSFLSSAPQIRLSSEVLRPVSHGIGKIVLLHTASTPYWNVLQAHIHRLCSSAEPHAVDVALDLLNGLAKCSGRICVEKTFPFLLTSLGNVISLGPNSDVLELCETLALVHLPLLDQSSSNAFFSCCLSVIRAFSKSGMVALCSQNSDSLDCGYQDIERLLILLHHCTAKDLFDFGPDVVTNGSDAAFTGLCVLLPLFSPSTLVHFPAISTSLYELLSSLVVTSPDKVIEMTSESQTALITAIEFSLHGSVRPSVQISGVNALKAIADYASSHDSKKRVLSPTFTQSLSVFQRHVLGLLLFEPISDVLFEPLADCLQPLIKADPISFDRLTSNLLTECRDDRIRHRLQAGFHLLLEGPPEATDQLRRGRFFFRQNCIAFVKNCRPFLQRK